MNNNSAMQTQLSLAERKPAIQAGTQSQLCIEVDHPSDSREGYHMQPRTAALPYRTMHDHLTSQSLAEPRNHARPAPSTEFHQQTSNMLWGENLTHMDSNRQQRQL